jgi:hypothetical protein
VAERVRAAHFERPGADAAIEERVRALEWPRLTQALDADGFALIDPLLDARECEALAALYADSARFRSRVIMARHGYGQGEYQYFDHPLPDAIVGLREALYAPLAPVANRWMSALGRDTRYPADHAAYVARCHARGQTRPTPLLLRYEAGDYNCLHQDVYGEELFPLQATFLLTEPREFDGGELVFTTSRPRRQTRAEVVRLEQGAGVIFAVRDRPEPGVRGMRRVAMRHGVSRIHAGHRMTLGIIFHDAK